MSDSNTVLLFRRGPDGRFEDTPYSSISGPTSRVDYPHDLAFSRSGNMELLAVAQRAGAVCIYRRNGATDDFEPEPIFLFSGREARLDFSDGVAFVPSAQGGVAACNLMTSSITFYRQCSADPIWFDVAPTFVLQHRSVFGPDGLAFSSSGRWLAVANHDNHTVSIYQRRRFALARGTIQYWPRPTTVLRDPSLRYPHSVAFTPKTNHLVVTNAGANYFSIYQPKRGRFGIRWLPTPVLRQALGPDEVFRVVNARNKMEGGPKGVAIHRDTLALCSPEYGVRIYAFHEPRFASCSG